MHKSCGLLSATEGYLNWAHSHLCSYLLVNYSQSQTVIWTIICSQSSVSAALWPQGDAVSLNQVSAWVREAQQQVGHSGRHIQEGSVFNKHISGLCVSVCLLDLGPPALYELCDLGDMESAQVEVMWQNVLSQLYQEAAIDSLPLEHSHRCLWQANEPQAGWHFLQWQDRQVSRRPPGIVSGQGQPFSDPHGRPAALCTSWGICCGIWNRLRWGARGLSVEGVQRPKGGKSTLWRRRPQASSRGEGVDPRLCPSGLCWLSVGWVVCWDGRGWLRTGRARGGAVRPGAGVTVQGSIWRGRAAGTEQEKVKLVSWIKTPTKSM